MKELYYIFCLIVAAIISGISVFAVFAFHFSKINFTEWPYPTSGHFWIALLIFLFIFSIVTDMLCKPKSKNHA